MKESYSWVLDLTIGTVLVVYFMAGFLEWNHCAIDGAGFLASLPLLIRGIQG